MELARTSRASATHKAYVADCRAWRDYAEAEGLTEYPVSPDALAAWLGFMVEEGLALSTIRRRCAAITWMHRGQGDPTPTDDVRVREVLRGIARKLKKAPTKKEALTAEMIRAMVDQLFVWDEKVALRDRAILLVGFMTGMRRAELAALRWEDIEEHDQGLIITIPQSKTDQEGEGHQVGLPRIGSEYCPVAALEEWRKRVPGNRTRRHADDSEEDPRVFCCTGKTIANVVKRHVKAIGEDPADFSGHSVRRGFMTEGHRAGGNLEDLMQQSRHTSREVAQGYIQATQLLQNPATLALARRLQQGDLDDG